ncbi:hypothetical protein LTR85_009677 [Meristemomyces frigidus]|nr:hypothetical protein LTR85_009677 [Meristemomyces frigidus]
MAHSNTSTMDDATAAHTVSATYELLENVLLYLPMLDILGAKSVSKQWKAAIESSLPLKKTLFLTCDTKDCVGLEEGSEGWVEDPSNYYLPMLQHRELQILPIFTEVPKLEPFDKKTPWTFHSYDSHDPPLPGSVRREHYLYLPKEAKTRLRGTIWRDTFLSQPPCTAVTLFVSWKEWGQSFKGVVDDRGVRLGRIVDELEKILRANEMGERECCAYQLPEVIISMV